MAIVYELSELRHYMAEALERAPKAQS